MFNLFKIAQEFLVKLGRKGDPRIHRVRNNPDEGIPDEEIHVLLGEKGLSGAWQIGNKMVTDAQLQKVVNGLARKKGWEAYTMAPELGGLGISKDIIDKAKSTGGQPIHFYNWLKLQDWLNRNEGPGKEIVKEIEELNTKDLDELDRELEEDEFSENYTRPSEDKSWDDNIFSVMEELPSFVINFGNYSVEIMPVESDKKIIENYVKKYYKECAPSDPSDAPKYENLSLSEFFKMQEDLGEKSKVQILKDNSKIDFDARAIPGDACFDLMDMSMPHYHHFTYGSSPDRAYLSVGDIKEILEFFNISFGEPKTIYADSKFDLIKLANYFLMKLAGRYYQNPEQGVDWWDKSPNFKPIGNAWNAKYMNTPDRPETLRSKLLGYDSPPTDPNPPVLLHGPSDWEADFARSVDEKYLPYLIYHSNNKVRRVVAERIGEDYWPYMEQDSDPEVQRIIKNRMAEEEW